MTYLVLGSNSFAGSAVVNYLLDIDEKVIGISRSAAPVPVLICYANHPNKANFTFHQIDLNQDFFQVEALIKKYKPRFIFDFAAQAMVAESWDNPEHWYQTNVVAKVKLHHFLSQCDFLERYLRASTPEVYGSTSGRVTEVFPFNPSTPYAVSQAATDMSLNVFFKQYQFPVVFTRLANYYGPCQQFYRIVPRVIIYALLNKKLQLHGGGVSRRAFIYQTDIASASFTALHKGTPGEAYHFSGDECVSIAELVRMICQEIGVDFNMLVEVAAERPGKDAEYYLDTEKAKQTLDWLPQVNLQQGIQHTIKWVKENIEVIKTLPMHYIHKA